MDSRDADDSTGTCLIFEGGGFSDLWDVYGRDGPSAPERDGAEFGARKLDPRMVRHWEKVGSVVAEGVAHLVS
jgi:hypothetical protein